MTREEDREKSGAPGEESRAPRGEALPREALVAVRNVPDEQTATMLRDFLRDQGIEATVVAVQIPWLSTVESLLHGYWGRIEVLGRDAERARSLLDDFFAATPERGEEEP
ncbi:MAG: hypothetical protein HY568_00280 [Candidatus Latescibacteria bacterium]|nr:hypothetical protein [Candidatus Latescibacterota bacterium]